MTVLLLVWIGLVVVAEPAPNERDDRCRARVFCENGRCRAGPDDGCVEGSTADCQRTDACLEEGQCEFNRKTKQCELKTRSTCKDGAVCRNAGRCEVIVDRDPERCLSASEASCRASTNCSLAGECALDAGECVVRDTADCAQSWHCRLFGMCEARDVPDLGRVCAVTREGCAASLECALFGKCVLNSEGRAGSVTSTVPRAMCKELGWCSALQVDNVSGKTCELESCRTCRAQACEGTEPCKRWGACTLVAGLCRVNAPVKDIGCEAVRVTGVVASATSTRPKDAAGHYDASTMVDRDARTFWSPASFQSGEVLTFKLPSAMRVTRVSVRHSSWFADRGGRPDAPFGVLALGLIRAGATSEMFYPFGWTSGPEGYKTNLPPTLTDTVSFGILALEPHPSGNPVPAIPEVVIEACPP